MACGCEGRRKQVQPRPFVLTTPEGRKSRWTSEAAAQRANNKRAGGQGTVTRD